MSGAARCAGSGRKLRPPDDVATRAGLPASEGRREASRRTCAACRNGIRPSSPTRPGREPLVEEKGPRRSGALARTTCSCELLLRTLFAALAWRVSGLPRLALARVFGGLAVVFLRLALLLVLVGFALLLLVRLRLALAELGLLADRKSTRLN